jgi:hypothetical protein
MKTLVDDLADSQSMARADFWENASDFFAQMTCNQDNILHVPFTQPNRVPLEQRASPDFEQDFRRLRS